MRLHAVFVPLLATGVLGLIAVAPSHADELLWTALAKGGQVVLMRHAVTTPGAGDPDGMKLEDCGTQRNLSDDGRKDARVVGESVRRRGVTIGEVRSSPWCRCLETARLAFGSAQVEPALANLYGRSDRVDAQVRALQALLSEKPSRGNRMLVSHGSTIAAVTGISPAPAEMVIVTPGGDGSFRVLGRLQPLAAN